MRHPHKGARATTSAYGEAPRAHQGRLLPANHRDDPDVHGSSGDDDRGDAGQRRAVIPQRNCKGIADCLTTAHNHDKMALK